MNHLFDSIFIELFLSCIYQYRNVKKWKK